MNKDFQGNVSQQAALFLKLIVNQNWTDESDLSGTSDSQKPFSMQDKENMGSFNQQNRQDAISQPDR